MRINLFRPGTVLVTPQGHQYRIEDSPVRISHLGWLVRSRTPDGRVAYLLYGESHHRRRPFRILYQPPTLEGEFWKNHSTPRRRAKGKNRGRGTPAGSFPREDPEALQFKKGNRRNPL